MDTAPLSLADNALRSRPAVIWVIVALLTLGGAALRIHDLGSASLWKDEIHQAQMSAGSVGSIFSGLRTVENDMPLDYLVQHTVMQVTPRGDAWVRLHAMVFGILSIPLAFLLLAPLLVSCGGFSVDPKVDDISDVFVINAAIEAAQPAWAEMHYSEDIHALASTPKWSAQVETTRGTRSSCRSNTASALKGRS